MLRKTSESKKEIDVILCVRHAIMCEITPSMRAIYVHWEEETFHHYFFFDGEFTEEEEEDARCIETEVFSQILDDFKFFEFHCKRLDYPAPIECPGICVYKRKEANSPQHQFRTLKDRGLISDVSSADKKWQAIALSGLEALIGSVTANLRIVEATWNEISITLSFIYDEPFSKEDEEEGEKVAARMAKDFPDSIVSTSSLRIDFPNVFPKHQEGNFSWLYARKEM